MLQLGRAASYTPTEDDVGKYLRATTVTYIDACGRPVRALTPFPRQAVERARLFATLLPEFLDEEEKDLPLPLLREA